MGLLEVLEGRVTKNGLWEAVPLMEELRVKGVSLNFGSLTRKGLVEERVHHGVTGEGLGTKRAEGAISKKSR